MKNVENIEIREADGVIILKLSKSLYEREAVFAAANKFTGRFGVRIHPEGEGVVVLTLIRSDNNAGIENLELAANEALNELFDQQVRLDLDKRNGRLREMIVQHAFNPIKSIEDELRKTNK